MSPPSIRILQSSKEDRPTKQSSTPNPQNSRHHHLGNHKSSRITTTATIAVINSDSEIQAKADDESEAADSTRLKSPSSSDFDKKPSSSIEDKVRPRLSALDKR